MIDFDGHYSDETDNYAPQIAEFAEDGSNFCFDNEDELIDTNDTISVRFNYPLRDKHIFELMHQGGWTRRAFTTAVAAKYADIYREEDESKTVSAEPQGMLMNRSTTDGKYGIWGHDIGDLVLEGATMVDGVWHIHIGS